MSLVMSSWGLLMLLGLLSPSSRRVTVRWPDLRWAVASVTSASMTSSAAVTQQTQGVIPLGLMSSAGAHTASYGGSCAYLCVCCSEAMEKLYGDRTGGFHGYSHLTGGFEGGQAEYARVPFGEILICILWSHDA